MRALTKDNIFQPYISDDDFRSSNVRADDVGYTLYVFGIKFQQNFTASLPIKVKFKFDDVGYTLYVFGIKFQQNSQLLYRLK